MSLPWILRCINAGSPTRYEGAENDINVSKTDQQLADVAGNMKEIEARLMALTNSQSQALNLHPADLPAVSAQMPNQLGYELLARRPDLQVAHWYIEASLSEVDAAKAAFYPDINLMAFLQQDALHLSDLFRHSAQQMGVTAGLTLPIFDSGTPERESGYRQRAKWPVDSEVQQSGGRCG